MTCRHDRLPKSVPKECFNFIEAAPVNARSKIARFEQPIVTVKHVKQPKKKPSNKSMTKLSKKDDSETMTDKEDYLCHVSFESTGGTNVSTVNALLLVDLYML
jgi:hypothetical protein